MSVPSGPADAGVGPGDRQAHEVAAGGGSAARGLHVADAAPADVQASWCAAFVDELVRSGVRHAVVCPGSRSAPLALALATDHRIAVHVRLDERAAGFFALGIALGSGVPAVVCTTSGTAAVELHPAVVEAHHARVPLVVCTADRPPELHDVAAPQTIDQRTLYGSALRWQLDAGVADPGAHTSWRSLAARLVAEARFHPQGPGPVHANLAMREPLLGQPSVVPPGRSDGGPWHRVVRPAPMPESLPEIPEGTRGVVVAGAGAGEAGDVLAAAAALGWPVLADPRSGCRVRHPAVVAAADALLRDRVLARVLRPEVVVRLGMPWASRVVAEWLDGLGRDGVPSIVVDPWWSWPDPGRRAPTVVGADPGWWCRWIAARASRPAPAAWLESWAAAEAAAQEAFDQHLAGQRGASEPAVARALARAVPAGTIVVAASSMPVRDLEWFAPPRAPALQVVANRGANGIDGTVATALGVAVGAGAPVVALVGDLAFLHDLSALVRPAGVEVPCTVVVADNGGGGIFSFLPQASAVPPARFEELFATPQGVDVVAAARGLGVPAADVDTVAGLLDALEHALAGGTISVIRVRLPPRAANVALHEDLVAAAAVAARRALGLEPA